MAGYGIGYGNVYTQPQGQGGLLGQQNGGVGGILGSAQQQQPEWAQKLGLFSSALKDASAAFSGQQDPGALAAWNKSNQQTQIRQQLLQGFSSQDPAQRQQAYTAAAMLGIPTDGIQKQQASSQLPAFLSSMKPSTQTLDSQSAPLPSGGNITTSPINFQAPGKNISEAIQSAPPELQGIYAPELIKQQMTAQADAAKPVTLSPGQVRFGGDGQQIASLPEKPTPNSPFNPDGSANVAYQKYEQGKVKAQQAPAWAGIAIQRQKLDNASKGLIDSDTIGFMADQVLTGDKSPFQNLGRGQQGGDNIAALRREVMTRAKARGLGGSDLASLNAEFSGLQAGERTLGVKTANIEMAATEARNLMPLVLDASAKVDRTQYPSINKVIEAGLQGTGDENVVRLGVSLNGLVNTYARAISPTGNPTVDDKNHARDILDKAWSKGQIVAAVGQMDKEIAAAQKSPGKVRGEFRSAISGRAPGVAAVPDAIGFPAPTSPAANLPRLPQGPKVRTFNPATGRLE